VLTEDEKAKINHQCMLIFQEFDDNNSATLTLHELAKLSSTQFSYDQHLTAALKFQFGAIGDLTAVMGV
jgi:hypothetical protein